MAKDTLILTRKVQVFIDCEDNEMRSSYYAKLFEWQDIVFRASNMVVTHQYVQENMKDFIYLDDRIKAKLTDYAKDGEGIFNTSRLNTTYQLLSHYFKGRLPSNILSNVNTMLNKSFNADRMAYWKGEKSLRNYRKDMPIPFSGSQLKLSAGGKAGDFKIDLFNIPFRTYLGKDRTDKKVLLRRILGEEIKICGSSLQIVKGKLFLLLALEMPKKDTCLEENIIAKASLSAEYPIQVNIGKAGFQIGSKEGFLHRRLAIQAAYERHEKAVVFNKGGKGRKRKFKKLDYYDQKEKSYIDGRLHLYSRRLIDICVASRAGTLILINPSDSQEIDQKGEFILYNWGYYGLLDKIKYKAQLVGINVVA